MADTMKRTTERNTSAGALLIMAKRPQPGSTKSRLCPPLSPGTAAELYTAFLSDALDIARSVPDIHRMIAYTPLDAGEYFRILAPDFDQIPQVGNALGERLDHVLTETLTRGFSCAVAVNSDSPNLPPENIRVAFEKLQGEETDIVLGPCEDGGYYLIGWKRPHPLLIRGVQMSTDRVLGETLSRAAAANLSVALLPRWYDVDEMTDLKRLWRDLREQPDVGGHTRVFLAQLEGGDVLSNGLAGGV